MGGNYALEYFSQGWRSIPGMARPYPDIFLHLQLRYFRTVRGTTEAAPFQSDFKLTHYEAFGCSHRHVTMLPSVEWRLTWGF
jgi:hypothetical protein